MALPVVREAFESIVEEFTFQTHGDKYEREFGHYVVDAFPNCERFWQVFVAPQTWRVEPRSKRDSSIRFRDNIHSELKHIAMAHYSMFFHLVYAHLHLEETQLFSFEDTYVHLASACGLANDILSHWYLILLQCQDRRSKLFEDLSRDEFLGKAGDWYDKHYEDTRRYYLSKGRTRPIRLVSERDLLKEYLEDTPHWPRYFNETNRIHVYRSVIIHDIRLGRILPRDATNNEYLVPRPEQVREGKYRTWEEVQKVAGDKNIVKQHFVERYELARTSLSALEQLLNDVWDKLIEDFAEEFYSRENPSLRHKFDIEFLDWPSDSLEYLIQLTGYPPGASEQFEADLGATSASDISSAASDGSASDIATGGSQEFSALWGEMMKGESEDNDE
jgi:hypothetical protein